MTSTGDTAQRIGWLASCAVHEPETADLNALLIAADEYLSLVRPGDNLDPELVAASRAMAYSACDHAVFADDDSRLRLDNALKVFIMLFGLSLPAEKLAD